MYYFSYGSNMSVRRFIARVPSARRVGTGILESHELKFHKVSRKDGTAKCDACETGSREHVVHGVVFHISAHEKSELDRVEGLHDGYGEKNVLVRLHDSTVIETFTYYATNIDPALKPLDWYREHVIIGARENNLPEDYIRLLEAVDYDEDPDRERRDRELSIYC